MQKKNAQRICLLTGGIYIAALFFIGLTLQELWRTDTVAHPTFSESTEEIAALDPALPVPPLLPAPAGAVPLPPQLPQASQQQPVQAGVFDLAVAALGRSGRWSLALQESLLQAAQAFVTPHSAVNASFRLRSLRLQATTSFNALSLENPDEHALIVFLDEFSGSPEAVPVWQQLNDLRQQLALQQQQAQERQLLLQRYEHAASRDDFAAALEVVPLLHAVGFDLAAAGYFVPVLVTTAQAPASLMVAGQLVAETDGRGGLGWWADPYFGS